MTKKCNEIGSNEKRRIVQKCRWMNRIITEKREGNRNTSEIRRQEYFAPLLADH
jgi:hypothetical protein